MYIQIMVDDRIKVQCFHLAISGMQIQGGRVRMTWLEASIDFHEGTTDDQADNKEPPLRRI